MICRAMPRHGPADRLGRRGEEPAGGELVAEAAKRSVGSASSATPIACRSRLGYLQRRSQRAPDAGETADGELEHWERWGYREARLRSNEENEIPELVAEQEPMSAAMLASRRRPSSLLNYG